jgi:hypothetical protein
MAKNIRKPIREIPLQQQIRLALFEQYMEARKRAANKVERATRAVLKAAMRKQYEGVSFIN